MEAMAKYFAREGRRVTVVTQTKSARDGLLAEVAPDGATLLELDWLGRLRSSPPPLAAGGSPRLSPAGPGAFRRLKDLVLQTTGQLLDPRIRFPLSMGYPWLPGEVRRLLETVDVIVGTSPPWPPMLAALNAGDRFKVPVVLDYRDQLSCCHEMPGSRLAKRLEITLDKYLARRAAAVVAISEPLRLYYSRFNPRSLVVLNGYDEERLSAAMHRAPWKARVAGEPLRIRYLGLITEGRVPRNLLEAMRILHDEGRLPNGSIELQFYGECALLERIVDAEFPQMKGLFRFFQAVPYDRALELIVSADHLLFCEQMIPPLPGQEESAAGILPTKLYEYLASGRPILGNVPPNGLAGQFIRKAHSRHLVSNDTKAFEAWLRSDRFWTPSPVPVGSFARSLSREVQAKLYLAHLDDVVSRAAVTNPGT